MCFVADCGVSALLYHRLVEQEMRNSCNQEQGADIFCLDDDRQKVSRLRPSSTTLNSALLRRSETRMEKCYGVPMTLLLKSLNIYPRLSKRTRTIWKNAEAQGVFQEIKIPECPAGRSWNATAVCSRVAAGSLDLAAFQIFFIPSVETALVPWNTCDVKVYLRARLRLAAL